MKVLLVHNEVKYFGGAEKMLGYFLEELQRSDCDIAVAIVPGSRVKEVIPAGIRTVAISDNQRFSVWGLCRQVLELNRWQRELQCDLLHGWAARDWELTSLAGKLLRRPAVGTLHDHPRARFHSGARQKLMLWAGKRLRKIVCVSEAVRKACEEAGYDRERLSVIHNGLPEKKGGRKRSEVPDVIRLGYLGVFLERKGFRGVFAILDEISRVSGLRWEARLAGGFQDPESERMVREIEAEYSKRPWWPQVEWCGWVKKPAEFLSSLDLLLCPSSEFDPFPTVLLEAGHMEIPVLAGRVGGVSEIVGDGEGGWLFEPGNWREAARILSGALAEPAQLALAGARGAERVREGFSVGKMVARYREVYSTV